jgi:hypothetical protein
VCDGNVYLINKCSSKSFALSKIDGVNWILLTSAYILSLSMIDDFLIISLERTETCLEVSIENIYKYYYEMVQKFENYTLKFGICYNTIFCDLNLDREFMYTLQIEEIRKIPCVDELRADVLAGGVEWLYTMMDGLKIQEVIVSDGDNLEGFSLARGILKA